MLHVVCIDPGGYTQHVNILYDMVRRNLADGTEAQFTVFTHTGATYSKGIRVRSLYNIEGDAWKFFYLFKHDIFEPGDHIVYFDLSAVIVGRLDEFLAWRPKFAYHVEDGKLMMASWGSGYASQLWGNGLDNTVDRRMLTPSQWLISRLPVCAEKIVDTWPDIIEPLDERAYPAKASVVFLKSDPSFMSGGWFSDVWRIGGGTRVDMDRVCNTDVDQLVANVRHNAQRDIPWFEMGEQKPNRHVCIVGGSPSLKDNIEQLRTMWKSGSEVWALNGAYTYLVGRNIYPERHVILDARLSNIEFLRNKHLDTHYMIASQVAPELLNELAGYNVTLFHPAVVGFDEAVLAIDTDKPIHMIGGGSTVGLMAMSMAFLSGAMTIALYGMDSCLLGSEHHSYVQPEHAATDVVDVVSNGKHFKCEPWMATQSQEFIPLLHNIVDAGCTVVVTGDGLLSSIAKQMAIRPYFEQKVEGTA